MLTEINLYSLHTNLHCISHPASYFVCQVESGAGLGSDLGLSVVGLSVDLAECHELGLHDDSFLLK